MTKFKNGIINGVGEKGNFETTGLISKFFGIDKRNNKGYFVTHLPTGRIIGRSKEIYNARQMVYNLENLDVDWDTITHKNLPFHHQIEEISSIVGRI